LGGETNSSNILFVELRADHSCFDEIFDICHSRESTQRWWEGLFYMTIGVTGHFDLESVEIEVGEHAVVGTACIVEWEL